MCENLKLHKEFLRKLKKNFFEFCIMNMGNWIDFKNNRCKCVRILKDLKKLFQYSQKYGQKDRFVTLFSDVRKKLFYDKNCVFFIRINLA